ncbi:hypothetical protein PM082_011187 [Marasmius tenuissimus]|nr:hypothetical protein PM082_011187 [Marasmius tenuissimus]
MDAHAANSRLASVPPISSRGPPPQNLDSLKAEFSSLMKIKGTYSERKKWRDANQDLKCDRCIEKGYPCTFMVDETQCAECRRQTNDSCSRTLAARRAMVMERMHLTNEVFNAFYEDYMAHVASTKKQKGKRAVSVVKKDEENQGPRPGTKRPAEDGLQAEDKAKRHASHPTSPKSLSSSYSGPSISIPPDADKRKASPSDDPHAVQPHIQPRQYNLGAGPSRTERQSRQLEIPDDLVHASAALVSLKNPQIQQLQLLP